jgi:hypothetical protein
MKKLLLSLFLFFTITPFCQPGDTISDRESKLHQRDSVISYYKNKRDSLTKALLLSDTDLIRQNTRTSTDYFVQLQKENSDKQKKLAVTRIAIGIAFLVILVIGLRRRGKNRRVEFMYRVGLRISTSARCLFSSPLYWHNCCWQKLRVLL